MHWVSALVLFPGVSSSGPGPGLRCPGIVGSVLPLYGLVKALQGLNLSWAVAFDLKWGSSSGQGPKGRMARRCWSGALYAFSFRSGMGLGLGPWFASFGPGA
jgi:hypothetical protein